MTEVVTKCNLVYNHGKEDRSETVCRFHTQISTSIDYLQPASHLSWKNEKGCIPPNLRVLYIDRCTSKSWRTSRWVRWSHLPDVHPLTRWTGHPQPTSSTIETALDDDAPGPQGFSESIWTPFFTSRTEDDHGCLRVNVLAGTDLEATLEVGRTPFLYVIVLLHKPKRLGMNVCSQTMILFTVFGIYSEPAIYNTINPLDPLWFPYARYSRDTQRKFYNKVRTLHMHFERYIFALEDGQGTILRLVEPDL